MNISSRQLACILLFLLSAGRLLSQVQQEDNSVWNKTVAQVINLTARNHPKIMGGCITMTNAGLGTALAIMAFEISRGRERDSIKRYKLTQGIRNLRSQLDSIKIAADADLHVFEDYLSAEKLPDSSLALKKAKAEALHRALLKTIASPLASAGLLLHTLQTNHTLLALSNHEVLPDIGSAFLQIRGALNAMLIIAEANIANLGSKEQSVYKKEIYSFSTRAAALEKQALSNIRTKIHQ